MKKYILYLEDDAGFRQYMNNLFFKNGYKVISVRRIDQAKEFFLERKDEIDCVIIDLNMDDEWLEEYQIDSDGGLLSGWVWLQKFVYPHIPNMPTIIFSGYIQYLKEYLEDKGQLYLLEKNHIKCVQKGFGDDEGFDGLMAALNDLTEIE